MTFDDWWEVNWNHLPREGPLHQIAKVAWEDAAKGEREAWESRVLDADRDAETLNEKGEALMALAAAIRARGKP